MDLQWWVSHAVLYGFAAFGVYNTYRYIRNHLNVAAKEFERSVEEEQASEEIPSAAQMQRRLQAYACTVTPHKYKGVGKQSTPCPDCQGKMMRVVRQGQKDGEMDAELGIFCLACGFGLEGRQLEDVLHVLEQGGNPLIATRNRIAALEHRQETIHAEGAGVQTQLILLREEQHRLEVQEAEEEVEAELQRTAPSQRMRVS